MYGRWVPVLGRHFRVLRVDRWGNGDSSKPPFSHQYTFENLIADWVGFLDALEIEKVHYIGDSLGGVIGTAFAAAHQERLKSLTLVNITTQAVNERVRQAFVREGYADGPSSVMGLGSWAWALTGGQGRADPTVSTSDYLRAIYRAERLAKIPAHVIAAWLRFATSFDIKPLLPSIKVPTLVISPGPDSVVTTPEEQRMLCDSIPDSEQVILDQPGMLAFDMAERCAEEVLRFIRSRYPE